MVGVPVCLTLDVIQDLNHDGVFQYHDIGKLLCEKIMEVEEKFKLETVASMPRLGIRQFELPFRFQYDFHVKDLQNVGFGILSVNILPSPLA